MIIAAQNKNEIERLNSSSGGIFPLIAKKIIAEGGIVFGAAFDKDFNVKHIAVESLDDLQKLYGSKYVFSDYAGIFKIIKDDLITGRKVLFSGSPCQVAGLRAFLKQDYQNLYVVDFICHGAPSREIWAKYLQELADGRKIKSVNFRSKKNGWTNYNFIVEFEDGKKYAIDHSEDPYMRGFINNLILQEACFHCKFKGVENRKSDLTLGDLWGAAELAPELFDDKGISLIFVNSEKGQKLLELIRDSIDIQNIDVEKALSINWAALRPAKPNILKKEFDKEYRATGNLTKSLIKYGFPNISLKVYSKILKLLYRDR